MKTIVLIACGKKKLGRAAPAKDLYQGELFKKSWKNACLRHPNSDIYILSAKHHLVDPKQILEPYDKTLVGAKINIKKQWAEEVIKQLQDKGYDLSKDHFVFYAGKDYYKFLIAPKGPIKNYELDFEGCGGIGYILNHLNKEIKSLINNFEGENLENCDDLRNAFSSKTDEVEHRAGVYRLWMQSNALTNLLKPVENLVDRNRILKRNIQGKDYEAVYVGMAKVVYDRLKWHVCDQHTESAIKSGFISTLRHTIAALLGDENKPLTKLEKEVNSVLDNNCLFEWEYMPSETLAECFESELIESGYYPLNIQKNKNIGKDLRKALTSRRKEVKK